MTERHRLWTTGLFEVRGLREVMRLPDPPPGEEIRVVVEGGVVRRLLSLVATFATSAAIADRIIHLQVLDADGTIIWDFPNGAAIPASTTRRLSAVPGVDPQMAAVDGVILLRAPDFILFPGETIRTATTNLQAGDKFSAVRLVWEWIPMRILEFAEEEARR